ncbi:MAG TPA: polysaccharide biosynthesis C-terminal domain-containing protein [Bacteroidales bacterium]|nr:polysaccharide biosynthesis C-terminal domain-containing protein [Bacteroidales bacterium]
MGVIQRQSISGVIWSYIGVGLGFLTTAIIFTRVLETEEIGLLRLLVSYSAIIAIFASLGMNTVMVKLFPFFRDPASGHKGFLGIALVVALAGFIVSSLGYVLLKPWIIGEAKENSSLFVQYFYTVVPLTFFTLLFGLLDTYYRVLFNAVKGIIYKEVAQRLLIIVVVGLYYFSLVDFTVLVWLYILAFAAPSVMFVVSLSMSGQLHLRPGFKYVDQTLKKNMISVAVFGIMASFSGVLVMSIDVIMIERFYDLSMAGVYTISFFFGTLILVPMRTMGKIGSVVIAEAWKADDRATISNIYTRSSITLTVMGLLLFIGIWGNIENVFHLVGDKFVGGRYVILFIGLANLADVVMGMSSHIIVTSHLYRWQTYLLVFFAALIIITNLLLIPIFGIVGAAIASFLSKVLFNGVKFWFIRHHFGFQPLSYRHLWLALIAVAAWYLSTLLPALPNYIIDIIVRSTLLTISFVVPVYLLKISEDVNGRVDGVIKILFRRFR